MVELEKLISNSHGRRITKFAVDIALMFFVLLGAALLAGISVSFFDFTFGIFLSLVIFFAGILLLARRGKFKQPVLNDTVALVDEYLGAKERLLTRAEMKSDVSKRAHLQLIEAQIQPLLKQDAEASIVPYRFSKTQKVCSFLMVIFWISIYLAGSRLLYSLTPIELQQAEIISKIAQDENLPENVRENLSGLADALAENSLSSDEVEAALANAAAEIDEALKSAENEELVDSDSESVSVPEDEVSKDDSEKEEKSGSQKDSQKENQGGSSSSSSNDSDSQGEQQQQQDGTSGEQNQKQENADNQGKKEQKSGDKSEQGSSEKESGQKEGEQGKEGQKEGQKEGEQGKEGQKGKQGNKQGSDSDGSGSDGQNKQGQGKDSQSGQKGAQEGKQGNQKENQSKQGQQQGDGQGQEKGGKEGQGGAADGQNSKKEDSSENKDGKSGQQKGEQGSQQGNGSPEQQSLNKAKDAVSKLQKEQASQKNQEKQDGQQGDGNKAGQDQNKGQDKNQAGKNSQGQKGERANKDSSSKDGEQNKSSQQNKEAGQADPKIADQSGQDKKSEGPGKQEDNQKESDPRQQGANPGGKGEAKKDSLPPSEKGNNEGKGEKNPKLPPMAVPSDDAKRFGDFDGGTEGQSGGKKTFKDVKVESEDEKFDTRFTGKDVKLGSNKKDAKYKTDLQSLELAKPEVDETREKQEIPLEYKDILD